MSKMREAFEKAAKEAALPLCYASFKAGYQAAIADVKAGGAVARFNWNEAKGFEWLVPYKYSDHHMKELYRLPEDV